MNMFCYQCQETAKNSGCTVRGVCGKSPETAKLQDLLIYTVKGLGIVSEGSAKKEGKREAGIIAAKALFATITNANFDEERIKALIREARRFRDQMKEASGFKGSADAAVWSEPEDQSVY